MTEAMPVAIPLANSLILALHFGSTLSDPYKFRTIVGSLQYRSLTHPDIAYTVNKLSQFMDQPTCDLWNAVKHLLRYLYRTIGHGVMFHRRSILALHAFSVAD